VWVLFSLNAFSQAERKYIRQGNADYKDGNFQQSELDYRKALEEDPSSYKADYNLGNALYKQNQFDAAAGRYSALAEKGSDTKTLGRYYYNLGNTLFQSQKYRESIDAYKMALRNNPDDLDAKHNLQLALRMMRESEQQNNQQQKGDENQEQQDKKEQQKEDEQKQQDQDQNQQDSGQQQQSDDPQQGQEQEQHKEGMTPEDAERILQALDNQEKEVMKYVRDQKGKRENVPAEKNW